MKLSKLSIPYRAVKTSGSLLAIFASSSLEASSFSPIYVLAGLTIFFLGSVLTGAWFYLVWRNFSFEITEDTFDIRSGVLNKQSREIPLHRIQNVDVRRSIFQRILGIAQVNLETAGGKTSEGSLKYVELDEAKIIQDKVRRLKQEKVDVVEDGDVSGSALFSLTGKELGVLSLVSLNAAAISGLAVGFTVLGLAAPMLDGFFSLSNLLVLGFIGFMVFVAGLCVSAASNVNKYYGFKLYRQGDSLEYERGLLNRSEGSIPFEKIQNLRIEENPLKRLLGYATLKVETAGYSGKSQEQQGAEVAVPLAERSHVVNLSNQVFDHGDYRIRGVSENALRRYFGRYTLLASVPVAGVLTLSRVFNTGFNSFLVLLLIPLLAVAAYLKYVNKGFCLGKQFFYTMNGFWNRKTTITPYYRVQTLSLSQTVFQKRLDTCSLVLDTAGIYVFASNPKAVDISGDVGDDLFKTVFESFKESSKN